ncbi:DMSO/selenate family reductase complex B subunit [Paraferrimonas haliotis]|uniref:Dimethylsulfoxide reductase, chain B n=1 Tax=Paraferrimonas haliotis TaxID=2013866 RepID=A0AA37TPF9_9GAMM|nr:DMSO/selenate family reductase complex B subunit [Paraferrimonas haliotis]GLS82276.1 dimethylsulfoxide reductase, chain B [Paraferrimonas haliotis]
MSDKIQYGFFVDTSVCSGCKTCHVTCKDKNDTDLGQKWRRVYEYGGGSYTGDADTGFDNSVYAYYVSIGCNHCDKPVCEAVCPVGAMAKRESDGLVLVDQTKCIGCKQCAMACPYDAPQFDTARGVMGKCDGCQDRLAEGKNPSCIDSCPLRALEFGPIDELRAKHGTNADIPGLPESSRTNPNLIIKVNPNAQAGAMVLNKPEV